jgi:HEXXH motif-containing protein
MPGQPRTSEENFPHLQISWSDFDATARSDSGAAGVRQLRHSERSRRLALIRSLVDAVSDAPEMVAPLADLNSAWNLLATVQKKDPTALDSVLHHPYTGSWASYATRLLSGKANHIWPLWVHLGYMHLLAAAAAIRAGIDFRIEVPVRSGGVVLPTLGLVPLPADDHTVAEIRGQNGLVEIRTAMTTVYLPGDLAADSPTWQPIRRLTAAEGDQTLAVRLDDIDPYRGAYEPLPPRRLDNVEVVAWRRLLAEAWALITRATPGIAGALSAGFDSIVPEPPTRFRPPSSTHSDAFGSAVLSRPGDPVTLAAMIIHEFQHSRLSGLEHQVELWQPDPTRRFYAPWRDDPRPVGGLFQGMYAHFGMTVYWRALTSSEDQRSEFEYAYHRAATWQVVELLRRDPVLTEMGRRFVSAIADILGPWQDEPVSPEAQQAAERTALDHYLGWRVRYIPTDRAVVDTLAAAWVDDRPPAGLEVREPEPRTAPDGDWSYARTDLVRLALTWDADQLRTQWRQVPGVTDADFALISGRSTDAVHGYHAALTADPDSPVALAGLALALTAEGNSQAARILLHRPELVRAVHRRLRPNPPAVPDLAAWIGRVID